LSSIQQKFSMHTRPNWAEVSLSALQHNFRRVRELTSTDVTICSVVKCDAYGHGVVRCSQALEQAGAAWLGVTSTEEAVAVREGGVRSRVLIMTGFWRGEEEAVLRHSLTPAIATIEHLESLERAAEALGRPEKSIAVHLKVDTGMSRLGLAFNDLSSFVNRLKQSRYVVLEGVFSHLASAEVLDAPDAKQQIAKFRDVVAAIEGVGIPLKFRHLANTAATLARPETWNNMVRPGVALYGYELPFSGNGSVKPLGLKHVLSWKTRIIATREIPAGTPVGYNGAWTAKRRTRLGVIPVGYGDGFTRHLSSAGRVIVREQYAPIVGNVSMDLSTIDLTDVTGADIGDEVVLIGQQGSSAILATEHARFANTVVYEILCGLSPRVPRIYTE
jgi:alanine racemase